MNKGSIIALAVVVVVIVIGFFVFSFSSNTGVSDEPSRDAPAGSDSVVVATPPPLPDDATAPTLPDDVSSGDSEQTHTIRITTAGFSPRELTINSGDTVLFVNQESRPSWPATAVHPSHTVYPGSGINKCGTARASDIFDACKGLERGESFSFMFTESGSWRYHDHRRSSLTGVIVVQ